MTFLKQTSMLTMMAAIMLFTSCQQAQQEQAESIYPDKEIPVSTESDEALQALVDGLHQMDLNQNEKARASFDQALAADPNFVSAQMYRTFTSNSAKDFAENRDKWLAMRDNANESEAIWMDIMEASMVDDEEKVMELAKQLVEKNPYSARAHTRLANAYSDWEQTDKTREHLQKAVELNPEFLPAINGLGFSYLFDTPKDFAKAEEYMARGVEIAPESSRAHINLGDCYRAQKDLEKALASYTKAAELDPGDEVAHSKAGHANSFLGNFDAARKNFQAARAASEFGTNAYDFEAYTYLYEGDHQKALDFLMAAAQEVDGMDIPASNKTGSKMNCTFNCAMIAMHHNNVEHLQEVVELMKPLSEQIGEDVGADAAKRNQAANRHYWDAVASAAAGDYEDAAAHAELIKTALESSNDPHKLRRYHRVHAMVNYKQGNYDKALEHMSELNLDNNIYDMYWAAKTHQALGDEEKAMELYTDIADYNFNNVGYALVRSEVKAIVAGES